MIITRGQETDPNNQVLSVSGLSDLTSQLCDLPTGVYSLEFLPRQEISHWENGIPIPTNRWYGIGVYRGSLTYNERTEDSVHGSQTDVEVGCLIVSDLQQAADQLHLMGNMRFVLRVTHYDGKARIIGSPGEYVRLASSTFNPSEIIGVQGYQISFIGNFTR